MAWSPKKCFWFRMPHKICAGAALLCYLIAAVGLPLPELPAEDSIPPSPCQDHPCCCQTARNGTSCCCCSGQSGRTEHASTEAKPPYADPQKSAPVSWMLGFTSPRCRGAAHLWVSIGAALPSPLPLEWSEPLIPIGWLSPHTSSPYLLPCVPPDPPPRFSCA
jgi:hypothetical protein